MLAAKHLESDGFAIKLLNLSTIKPLDQAAIVFLARETGAIVTAEEHEIAAAIVLRFRIFGWSLSGPNRLYRRERPICSIGRTPRVD